MTPARRPVTERADLVGCSRLHMHAFAHPTAGRHLRSLGPDLRPRRPPPLPARPSPSPFTARALLCPRPLQPIPAAGWATPSTHAVYLALFEGGVPDPDLEHGDG